MSIAHRKQDRPKTYINHHYSFEIRYPSTFTLDSWQTDYTFSFLTGNTSIAFHIEETAEQDLDSYVRHHSPSNAIIEDKMFGRLNGKQVTVPVESGINKGFENIYFYFVHGRNLYSAGTTMWPTHRIDDFQSFETLLNGFEFLPGNS